MDRLCISCSHQKQVHSLNIGGCRVADCACLAFREVAPTPVTPSELRRSVLAALKEREQCGDTLATGAIKVIKHLEDQANRLAWGDK